MKQDWDVFICGIHVGRIISERARSIAQKLGTAAKDGRIRSGPVEVLHVGLEPEWPATQEAGKP